MDSFAFTDSSAVTDYSAFTDSPAFTDSSGFTTPLAFQNKNIKKYQSKWFETFKNLSSYKKIDIKTY
jgi:hypothetical protein